jgi:hypothetical protein
VYVPSGSNDAIQKDAYMMMTGASRYGLHRSGAVFAYIRGVDETVQHTASDMLMNAGAFQPYQTASSFGHSVAFADLNGDGIPEILVGAPHYHIYDAQRRRAGGLVYIFCESPENVENVLNGNTRIEDISDRKPWYTISGASLVTDADCERLGSHCELGQFGYAIQPLGDVDQGLDGGAYEDFAVSAPFQQGGVIYVFHGHSGVCRDTPSPLLHERFNLTLDNAGNANTTYSFGASLDFGMDVDGNGFPDLLAGAPLQDSAFILLSMPVSIH